MARKRSGGSAGEPWLVYGAYGATGRLIVEYAVARGHRPLLVGRDVQRLAQVATRYGLPSQVMDLKNLSGLRKLLGAHRVVINAAGPYLHTSQNLSEACLDTGTHSVDLSGELAHLQAQQQFDTQAREKGLTLVSGAGFDITFGEAVAAHVYKRLPDANGLRLSVARNGIGRSQGTARSIQSVLAGGGCAIVEGALVPRPLAHDRWSLRGRDGSTRHFAAAPLPELIGAQRATAIPNIIAGQAVPLFAGAALRALSPLIRGIAARLPASSDASSLRNVGGGEEAHRQHRSYIWAEAWNYHGHLVMAELETGEAYRMSAIAAVHAVEALLEGKGERGALTPATAFGTDFALGLPQTHVADLI